MPTITTEQAMEMALAHFNAGRREEARQVCEQILAAFPQHWPSLLLLGVIRHQSGDPQGGIELLRRAIAIEPNFADLHNNLGEMLRSIGQLDEAAKCFARCLALNPASAATYSNLGELYRQQQKFDEAIANYRKSLELEPNNPTPWMNMAVALHESRRVDESIECYRKAIALAPGYVDAHGNLGAALMDAARPDEAMAEFELALRLQPNNVVAHVNLGTALTYQHRMDAAIATLERAVAIEPRWGEAHTNLAYALLLKGNWERGFEEYEWRWTGRLRNQRREFKQPMWDGSDPAGKRILVYPEQGLGDAIQFARYVPLLAERGATVILETYPSQRELMRSLPGVSELIERDQAIEFDLQIPVLSLPRAFKTTPQTVPANAPYLSADAGLVERWQETIGAPDGRLRVGLAWAGRTTYTKDLARSMSLAQLAPLANIPRVRWYSLQLGPQAEEPAPPGMELVRLHDQIKSFSDSAALLSNLDLLITVDTAQAHLAGAVGRRVWTMIPFNGDWRWGLEGDTTPWYPTMRLFRQPRIGDWNTVVTNVVAMLQSLADSQ